MQTCEQNRYVITEAATQDKEAYCHYLKKHNTTHLDQECFKSRLLAGRNLFEKGKGNFDDQGHKFYFIKKPGSEKIIAVGYLKGWNALQMKSAKFHKIDGGFEVVKPESIFYPHNRLIEIAGISVHPDWQQKGLGFKLVYDLVEKANEIIKKQFADCLFYLFEGDLKSAWMKNITYCEYLNTIIKANTLKNPGPHYWNLIGFKNIKESRIVISDQDNETLGYLIGKPRKKSIGSKIIAEKLTNLGLFKRTDYYSTVNGGRYYLNSSSKCTTCYLPENFMG